MMPVKKASSSKTPIPFTPVERLPNIMAALIYGRTNTGKTRIACTFPKPLLLLDIREKGTDSVSNVKGVHVGSITEWKQFEDVYWYLNDSRHDYSTIVVDQLTQLEKLALNEAKRNNRKDEDDQTSKRDFGAASGMLSTWILNYRDLIDKGINVVFNAHDRLTGGTEDEMAPDEGQIDPSVGPRLMPSVASFVAGSVKLIGNTFIRETYTIKQQPGSKLKKKIRNVEYCMRLGPHAYYATKTRTPVGIAAPATLVDPDYDKLMAIMAGDYSETPSTVRRK
jgi:hypothetical protein